MEIITVRQLTHRFVDGTLGLKGVDLRISEGEFIVLAGRNGSGKTVLVRHFNGLLEPTEGFVSVSGVDVHSDPMRARRMVGLLFQESDSQIVGETVRADVAFGPRNLMLPPEEIERRVSDALRCAGLQDLDGHAPHLLSGGEKRRLALAGVLAMEPKVLVFDEPFSNLDYPGVLMILERIVSLHEAGHTVILITHDLDKVLAHADRLVLMDDGRVVRAGPPGDLLREVETFGVRMPRGIDGRVEDLTWLR